MDSHYLKNYVPKSDQDKITTIQNLKNYFKDNPFNFTNYIPTPGRQEEGILEGTNSLRQYLNKSKRPSTCWCVLTQVIIQRAKQELTVAFFDHFRAELKKYSALDSLFPKTTNFMMNIGVIFICRLFEYTSTSFFGRYFSPSSKNPFIS